MLNIQKDKKGSKDTCAQRQKIPSAGTAPHHIQCSACAASPPDLPVSPKWPCENRLVERSACFWSAPSTSLPICNWPCTAQRQNAPAWLEQTTTFFHQQASQRTRWLTLLPPEHSALEWLVNPLGGILKLLLSKLHSAPRGSCHNWRLTFSQRAHSYSHQLGFSKCITLNRSISAQQT